MDAEPKLLELVAGSGSNWGEEWGRMFGVLFKRPSDRVMDGGCGERFFWACDNVKILPPQQKIEIKK